MTFSWFVALRFLREGRTQTALILSAVTVGVGVIVFLSALIDGLQASLVEKTLTSQAHVIVLPAEAVPRVLEQSNTTTSIAARVEKAPQRERTIAAWQPVLETVATTPGVVAAAAVVQGNAFASRGSVDRAIALRGIDAEAYDRVLSLSAKIVAGRLLLAGTQVVIGTELADELGARVGDKIRVATGGERSDVFEIAGIFDLGNKDANARFAFVPLRSAQTLVGTPGEISTIEVKVADVFAVEAVASRIAARTGLEADSWMQRNQQLMIGLRSQSASRWMIEFFVVIAVALGIASVLAVSVVQKSREIGILKAFGTSTGKVMRIFLIEGGLVGVGGSLVGCVLGAVLSLFFARLAKNPDGSALFPVYLRFSLFAGASAVATLTGLGAALLPARRAAKLDPAAVIRYG